MCFDPTAGTVHPPLTGFMQYDINKKIAMFTADGSPHALVESSVISKYTQVASFCDELRALLVGTIGSEDGVDYYSEYGVDTDFGKVYSVDIETGAIRWSVHGYDCYGMAALPAIETHAAAVFVSSSGGRVSFDVLGNHNTAGTFSLKER